MTLFDFAVRICCAVGFGFLIGLERQLTGHAVGLVEIEASIRLGGKRRDFHVEKLTSCIALEKGVIKVGWALI